MTRRRSHAANSTGLFCRSARICALGRQMPVRPLLVARNCGARVLSHARRRQGRRIHGRLGPEGLAGTLRFNSDLYQIFSALAVSALPGFSSVQNPILAMMG